MRRNLSYYCSRYIYNGVILHAHPARGESHNQRNATGEVATQPKRIMICHKSAMLIKLVNV